MGDELSMDLIMTGDEAEDLFLNNSPLLRDRIKQLLRVNQSL